MRIIRWRGGQRRNGVSVGGGAGRGGGADWGVVVTLSDSDATPPVVGGGGGGGGGDFAGIQRIKLPAFFPQRGPVKGKREKEIRRYDYKKS